MRVYRQAIESQPELGRRSQNWTHLCSSSKTFQSLELLRAAHARGISFSICAKWARWGPQLCSSGRGVVGRKAVRNVNIPLFA